MRVIILAALASLMAGCGGSRCSDSDVKRTLVDLIQSSLDKAEWYQEMKADIADVDVSGISTVNKSERSHTTRSAIDSFPCTGSHYEKSVSYDLTTFEDKTASRYRSMLTA